MKMATLPFLLGLAVAALASFLVWKFMGMPVDIVDAPAGKVHCVSYTPYRGSETPFDRDFVASVERIDEDFALLSSVTDCIRIYSVDLGLDKTVPLAAKYNMQVLLGIWIGREDDKNEMQIAHAIDLANSYPKTIRAIIVGNEVLLRGEQTPEALIGYMKTVKAATGLPVTYADVTDFWMKAPPELAAAADFVTIHILPYWENDPTSASQGVAYLKSVRDETAAHFPDKSVFIGETGFPSAGRQRAEAVPSLVGQARYLREFAVYADREDFDYNLIEAFDQPWKRALEGTVGGNWGFFTTGRTPKFAWTGPVSEYPQWRTQFAMSFMIAALILALMAWRGERPEPLGGFMAGVGTAALGTALILQAEHSLLAWRTPFEGAVEIFVFIQSLAVIVLVLPELTRGSKAAGPLPVAETIAWLRAPDRAGLGLPLYLGMIQLAAISGALVISLGLSFDARYRDFPIAAYGIAALSFALLALNRGDHRRQPAGRREEMIFTALLVLTACVIAFNEGPWNMHALAWCVLNLIFALPFLGISKAAIRDTLVRSGEAARA